MHDKSTSAKKYIFIQTRKFIHVHHFSSILIFHPSIFKSNKFIISISSREKKNAKSYIFFIQTHKFIHVHNFLSFSSSIHLRLQIQQIHRLYFIPRKKKCNISLHSLPFQNPIISCNKNLILI